MGKRETMREFKEELKKDIEIEALYLFGSRARGDFREDSDYDIAVVSEDFADMSFPERQEIVLEKARKVTDKPVEILCYTPEEFEKGKEGFMPEIIEKEGIKS
ncbi:MAG: nucleotidyltransferase domain-containing protein [Candidatus Nanohalobium sp.]